MKFSSKLRQLLNIVKKTRIVNIIVYFYTILGMNGLAFGAIS
jgi:hypothetical protein